VHIKFYIFHSYLLASAILLASIASAMFGYFNWVQSRVNYNTAADIQAAKESLATMRTDFGNAMPICMNLSTYNAKVINSRMLLKMDPKFRSILSNEYLKKLLPSHKETAKKTLAVTSYGIMISIAIGLFSLLLTLPTIWLILIALIMLTPISKQKYGKK
jgi:hypothetical protein